MSFPRRNPGQSPPQPGSCPAAPGLSHDPWAQGHRTQQPRSPDCHAQWARPGHLPARSGAAVPVSFQTAHEPGAGLLLHPSLLRTPQTEAALSHSRARLPPASQAAGPAALPAAGRPLLLGPAVEEVPLGLYRERPRPLEEARPSLGGGRLQTDGKGVSLPPPAAGFWAPTDCAFVCVWLCFHHECSRTCGGWWAGQSPPGTQAFSCSEQLHPCDLRAPAKAQADILQVVCPRGGLLWGDSFRGENRN